MNSSSPPLDSSPEVIYNFRDNWNLLAAVMLLVMGSFGAVCNGTIVYIFCKESSERTSFNLICVFRATISLFILISTFILVFFFSTLLGFSIFPEYLESSLINTSLTLYIGSEYQVVLVAVNRFLSLFFPFFYQKYCGIKPTLLILTVFYGYRLFSALVLDFFLMPDNCDTLFYPADLTWSFNFDPRCAFGDSAFDGAVVIFSSMTMLNVVTFCRILWFLKASQNESKETRKRAKKNALLFCQTVLQDSLYIIDLTFTYKLNEISTHRFWSFICGTFVWESLHSFDGFIMLMFNERLSLLKKRLFTPSQTSVQMMSNVHPSRPALPNVG